MRYDPDAITDLLDQVQDEGDPRLELDLDAALAELPPAWAPLRAHADRRAALRALWAPLEGLLPATIEMLGRKLAGFAILRTDAAAPSLLYLLDQGRDLIARRGYAPVAALPEVSAKLPTDLGPLYRLHDGWVNLFGADGGPLPTARWQVRGHKKAKIAGFLEVFARGSQALGFDLDKQPARPFAMDTADGSVDKITDFWKELDARLAAGMKRLPDAAP